MVQCHQDNEYQNRAIENEYGALYLIWLDLAKTKPRFVTKIVDHIFSYQRTFFCIRLPLLGPLEWYVTPALDASLLCSSRAGSDLGHMSDWF